MWDSLWINLSLLKMDGRPDVIHDGALGIQKKRIVFSGAREDLPDEPKKLADSVLDGSGALATPSLIDPHTHLVFAGDRSAEFEARLEGVSYSEIARAGGGILGTVKATRSASEQELFEGASRRLTAMITQGLGAIEIKSGYGLRIADEIKMLRVARRLAEAFPVEIRTTFLGAHALAPEYTGRADHYIEMLCKEMMPAIAAEGLADAVDVFCEGIGFSPDQTRRVFETARDLGLPIKIHAEQLSDLGGAALAAEYGALSADHLEYLSESGIEAMARAGMVAVLLPGAYYFLNEKQKPPVKGLRRHGVPMALATDANPGSSPIFSPLVILNMGSVLFGLTVIEAISGMTRHAATALGMEEDMGSLTTGKYADFCLWDVASPAELVAAIGLPRLRFRVHRGRLTG